MTAKFFGKQMFWFRSLSAWYLAVLPVLSLLLRRLTVQLVLFASASVSLWVVVEAFCKAAADRWSSCIVLAFVAI